MNYISKKNYRQYDNVSTYATFPYYYHELDDAYFYGITDNLDNTTPYTTHKVEQKDTLDSLAMIYYGRPDLYRIIADFNRIRDPFIKLSEFYTDIKIPSYGSIEYRKAD